jgi:hypothetical protein
MADFSSKERLQDKCAYGLSRVQRMLVTCDFEITALRLAETPWNYSAKTLNPIAFSRIRIPRMIARMPGVADGHGPASHPGDFPQIVRP